MFQKAIGNANLKSDSNRLCQASETLASNFNDRINLASTSRQHQQQNYQNYFSNRSKEENKSQRLPRNSNFNSLYQHSQMQSTQEMQQNNSNNIDLNQRIGQQMTRSTTNPQLYQVPLSHNYHHHHNHHHPSNLSQPSNPIPPQTSSLSKTTSNNDFNHVLAANRNQAIKQRTSTTNTIMSYPHVARDDDFRHDIRHDQQERETDEVVTMIKEEELDNDFAARNETDLETLESFQRELPIELSFLIRQLGFCMARMNYLDRQVRELRDTKQVPQVPTTSMYQSQHNNRLTNTATTSAQIKNGNFIPSDDSGGEYSRATISDDDELSSLLDQIAKSVRPERHAIPSISSNQQQQAPRTSYSVMSNQPQPYAIINTNQLHHQAVPVFVMGSPIAVAHPSSISSTVPGVHFQPEPRYNQYYEDFYVKNNPPSTMHRHDGVRSQFDSSITAIEQLVSQKEKRQIRSQSKSADNWLKMRSSGLSNNNDNFTSNIDRVGNSGITGGDVVGNTGERNIQGTSSSAAIATENSNNVIEENDI